MTTLGSAPSSSYSWRILRHPFLTDRTLRKYGIRRYLICDLNLPTGRVLACDPVTSVGYVKPLAQTVPPGRYPVFGYEALVKAPDHYKTALIELWLNDAPNESWRLALQEGQAAETDIFDASYGVDAAAACFCDATAQPFLVYAEENYDPDGDDDVNLLEVAFGCGRGEEHRFPNSELNMAVFTTGDGDGTYPCFWNYDDAGCPSRLVTISEFWSSAMIGERTIPSRFYAMTDRWPCSRSSWRVGFLGRFSDGNDFLRPICAYRPTHATGIANV